MSSVIVLPVNRRDVPHTPPPITRAEGEPFTRLNRKAQPQSYWSEPKRSAEMELILCLIAQLKEHKGLSKLGTEVLYGFQEAMQERNRDPSLHRAVNELCSGAY